VAPVEEASMMALAVLLLVAVRWPGKAGMWAEEVAESATGYLKPASRAIAETSIRTPSRMASARV
jgi:hypothetical protein